MSRFTIVCLALSGVCILFQFGWGCVLFAAAALVSEISHAN